MQSTQPNSPTANAKIALLCVGIVAGMIGLAYASVPLYDLFCRVTGYGGTTSVSTTAADTILDSEVVVRFDASLNSGMPWDFAPVAPSQRLHIGEQAMAFYRAHNPTDRAVVGTATFNVTPFEAGQYFVKIDCFCFQEQVLGPGETANMPVSYYVDPAIADDPYLRNLKTITLSYTFFEMDDPSEESLKKMAAALPDNGSDTLQ